jgi:hypothetical protein
MIAILLAALVAAGGELPVSTLAGVTLGSDATRVVSNHPGAQKATDSYGRWWRWRTPAGGLVTITADDNGRVNRVDFKMDKSVKGSVDLPCIGTFRLRDSDARLNAILNKTPCSAFNGAAYGVPGGSVVALRFDSTNESALVEATWYRDSGASPAPVGHLREVIDSLRPILKSIGGAARIYYAGTCPTREAPMRGISFPSVWLQQSQGTADIDAVRQVFRDNPNVTVRQDLSGRVTIVIGTVSSALLNMNIPKLTFSPSEQYTALSAVEKIEIAASIEAQQQKLPFWRPPTIVDHLLQEPIVGLPHLPSLMQNIELGAALDAVAATFNGIATYGECIQPDGKSLFEIDFDRGSAT